jgi:hypothetical protein
LGSQAKWLETHWSAREYSERENYPLNIRQEPKKKNS